jgi:hypothetical protein
MDPPPKANTKAVSEAAMKNDLNMKFPIFLVRSRPEAAACSPKRLRIYWVALSLTARREEMEGEQ